MNVDAISGLHEPIYQRSLVNDFGWSLGGVGGGKDDRGRCGVN